MKKVNIRIENHDYQVDNNLTILNAARLCGYNIPSLCSYHNGECSIGSCRVCLVEVKGYPNLVASCTRKVSEGMEISISTQKAINARRISCELLLSSGHQDCKTCDKSSRCELLYVAKQVGVRENGFEGIKIPTTIDMAAPAIFRDSSKCILCGRCVVKCEDAQGLGILNFQKRGLKTIVAPVENRSFHDSPCIQCGQCITVCPTGALAGHIDMIAVDKAMSEKKTVIVQVAPAVRAAIAEEFDEKIGTDGTGKMVAALRRLGFSKVFDTNFAADLTIMEEASELIQRVKDGKLPLLTSCSPGWINYLEYYYPELIKNVSSCKSPHQMMGAMIKSYYAKNMGLDPKDIYVVSVMPCIAKKYERQRIENSVDGICDVDAVITTRGLARMIRRVGLNWQLLPKEDFDDDFMGKATGASEIFGSAGGVTEAALRTAYKLMTGYDYGAIEFNEIRGFNGVKEASIEIGDITLNVACVSGMKNAKPILEEIKNGTSKYHFIEMMACPGGCVNGGGQPYVKPMFLPNEDFDILSTYIKKRSSVLYNRDLNSIVRASHKNPNIIKLYNDFLIGPGSKIAHKYLHTKYNTKREKYPSIDV